MRFVTFHGQVVYIMKYISIAKDFSKNPAGASRLDGPKSGQEFRENILIPQLKAGLQVIIDMVSVKIISVRY